MQLERNCAMALVGSLLWGCATHPTVPAYALHDPLHFGDAVAPRYTLLSGSLTAVPVGTLAASSTLAAATASASSDRNPAWFAVSNLVDGNLHSAWEPAASDASPNLTLRLTHPGSLLGLGIKMEDGATFDVAVSDGGAWTTVASHVHPLYRTLDFLDLAVTQVQQIRLTYHVRPGAQLAVCEVRLLAGNASPSPGPSLAPSPTPSPSTLPCAMPIDLGPVLARVAVLASSTVTNTGESVLNGDVAMSTGSAIAGFSAGTIAVPYTTHLNDLVAQQAQLDLAHAYAVAAALPPTASLPAGLAGDTLLPGVYRAPSSVTIAPAGLTLDGNGDPNAVFVFQIGSALTVASGAHLVLSGGAQANHVFFQVGSSATFGTASSFQGSILALASITLNTGARLCGRALARTGAVTLDDNSISPPALPAPCDSLAR